MFVAGEERIRKLAVTESNKDGKRRISLKENEEKRG